MYLHWEQHRLRFLSLLFVIGPLVCVNVGCQRSTPKLDNSVVVKDSKLPPPKEERGGKVVHTGENPEPSFNPKAILSWPRMRADRFGCMLEKVFDHRDPKFNCSLTYYKNKGDPCKNTTEYYSGPAFPRAKVASVDPLLANLELSWEHGNLQAVALTFKDKQSVSRITERYGLPTLKPGIDDHTLAEGKEFGKFPNIANISIQTCHKERNCLLIEGFEHMGAGEVDCGN